MPYQKLLSVMKSKGITRNKLAVLTGIAPPDIYQAISGQKPFYPGWRKRVAQALQMEERELFPEDVNHEKSPDD